MPATRRRRASRAHSQRSARESAAALGPRERRAAEILFHRVLSSAIFETFPPLYRREGPRRPCLDLPFRGEDFRGVWLPPIRPA